MTKKKDMRLQYIKYTPEGKQTIESLLTDLTTYKWQGGNLIIAYDHGNKLFIVSRKQLIQANLEEYK
jgi:hypothetical protein